MKMSLKFIQINIENTWWVKCKKRVNQNSIKEKLNQKFTISASNEALYFFVGQRFQPFQVLYCTDHLN
jgi:hypothetical protein